MAALPRGAGGLPSPLPGARVPAAAEEAREGAGGGQSATDALAARRQDALALMRLEREHAAQQRLLAEEQLVVIDRLTREISRLRDENSVLVAEKAALQTRLAGHASTTDAHAADAVARAAELELTVTELRAQLVECVTREEGVRMEASRAVADRDFLMRSLGQLEQAQAQMTLAIAAASQQATEAMRQRDAAVADNEAAQRWASSLQESLAQLQDDVATAVEARRASEAEAADALARVDAADALAVEMRLAVARVTAERDHAAGALAAALASVAAERADGDAELATLRQKLVEAETTSSGLERARAALASDLQACQAELAAAQASLTAATTSAAASSSAHGTELAGLQTQLEDSKRVAEARATAVASLEAQVTALTERAAHAESNLRSAAAETAGAAAEKAKLHSRLTLLERQLAGATSTAAAMEAARLSADRRAAEAVANATEADQRAAAAAAEVTVLAAAADAASAREAMLCDRLAAADAAGQDLRRRLADASAAADAARAEATASGAAALARLERESGDAATFRAAAVAQLEAAASTITQLREAAAQQAALVAASQAEQRHLAITTWNGCADAATALQQGCELVEAAVEARLRRGAAGIARAIAAVAAAAAQRDRLVREADARCEVVAAELARQRHLSESMQAALEAAIDDGHRALAHARQQETAAADVAASLEAMKAAMAECEAAAAVPPPAPWCTQHLASSTMQLLPRAAAATASIAVQTVAAVRPLVRDASVQADDEASQSLALAHAVAVAVEAERRVNAEAMAEVRKAAAEMQAAQQAALDASAATILQLHAALGAAGDEVERLRHDGAVTAEAHRQHLARRQHAMHHALVAACDIAPIVVSQDAAVSTEAPGTSDAWTMTEAEATAADGRVAQLQTELAAREAAVAAAAAALGEREAALTAQRQLQAALATAEAAQAAAAARWRDEEARLRGEMEQMAAALAQRAGLEVEAASATTTLVAQCEELGRKVAAAEAEARSQAAATAAVIASLEARLRAALRGATVARCPWVTAQMPGHESAPAPPTTAAAALSGPAHVPTTASVAFRSYQSMVMQAVAGVSVAPISLLPHAHAPASRPARDMELLDGGDDAAATAAASTPDGDSGAAVDDGGADDRQTSRQLRRRLHAQTRALLTAHHRELSLLQRLEDGSWSAGTARGGDSQHGEEAAAVATEATAATAAVSPPRRPARSGGAATRTAPLLLPVEATLMSRALAEAAAAAVHERRLRHLVRSAVETGHRAAESTRASQSLMPATNASPQGTLSSSHVTDGRVAADGEHPLPLHVGWMRMDVAPVGAEWSATEGLPSVTPVAPRHQVVRGASRRSLHVSLSPLPLAPVPTSPPSASRGYQTARASRGGDGSPAPPPVLSAVAPRYERDESGASLLNASMASLIPAERPMAETPWHGRGGTRIASSTPPSAVPANGDDTSKGLHLWELMASPAPDRAISMRGLTAAITGRRSAPASDPSHVKGLAARTPLVASTGGRHDPSPLVASGVASAHRSAAATRVGEEIRSVVGSLPAVLRWAEA